MHKLSRINPVLETLKASPERINKILIQQNSGNNKIKEIQALARSHNIPLLYVPKKHLDRSDRHHQGLLASVAPKEFASVNDLLTETDNPFLVLLDGIEDPHNLGAVIRTGAGAGVDGIIIPERRSAGLTDAVYSVSAGALEYVKVARVKNLARTMDELRNQGIWVIGAEGNGDAPWYDFDFTLPVALVMGSEGQGLHELVRKKCDQVLFLPLTGHISSLNVSAAAAVLMYEVVRQRHTRQGKP